MLKYKTCAFVYKKVFNLVSNNNRNVMIASKEIQQILNNYGYKTKIIKTTDCESIKYSLSNLYKNYDFVINDCSSLKDIEHGKLIHEIKNNNFCSWTPYQVSVCDSINIKIKQKNIDLIYSLKEPTNKKEQIILKFV